MRRRIASSVRASAHSWPCLGRGRIRYLCTASDVHQAALLDAVTSIPPSNIRNFAIISHVDHGKSTLSDRLMSITGAVPDDRAREQLLDSLDVERERGITIKAQTVSLLHRCPASDELYLLNLIDTPGHVDFSYEVSRSIAACQGALLLVDATKGVQAQTVANFFLAFEQELAITPVVNKVDLAHANVDGALEQMRDAFDISVDEALRISAKTGMGCDALIPALIHRMPPPMARAEQPLRLLLFDSWYDEFLGVLCLVEVLDGTLKVGEQLVSAATGKQFATQRISLMRPLGHHLLETLGPGQVGCVSLGMKQIDEACVGDTLSSPSNPQPALPGFKRPQPMVFAGLFPTQDSAFEELQYAMSRFLLKDGSVQVEHEQSASLGRGLRCGFLGMLHMEVVQQRLEREHGVEVIVTAPTVPLQATLKRDGTVKPVLSAEALPPRNQLRELQEPLVCVTLLSPSEHTGALISLCEGREGEQLEHSYIGTDRALLRYRMPLAEIVTEFHDRVKTISSGFASVDYEDAGMQPADVVSLGVRVNSQPVDALTRIVRRGKATRLGREMVETLANEMDRAVYEIIIQAVVDGKVVARETLKATRKNVLAKCYGGDITRKKKLLEKQKAGKKRAALTVGQTGISIPQEAFVAVLSPGRRKEKKGKGR
jgi:elongation factor 4